MSPMAVSGLIQRAATVARTTTAARSAGRLSPVTARPQVERGRSRRAGAIIASGFPPVLGGWYAGRRPMRHAATGAPFDERGGRLRGVIDFAAGRYPGFLVGLRPGRILPVFHFHETTAGAFEPVCRYLVENGYRTVVSDDAARFVREGVYPGDRSVMLAFDDAWASLWLVVEPLLRRYDLCAVAYVIPARTLDADAVRPT